MEPDESDLHTTQLHLLVDRIRGGDALARDEFVRRVRDRVEQIAHKMLRQYANVRRWEETDDVAQQVLMNLLKSVESGSNRPGSLREFYSYASVCVRNSLLDLARRYRGTRAPLLFAPGDGQSTAGNDPIAAAPAACEPPEELQLWCDFHEAVGRLPAKEREVVGLKFYHGWTNQEIGDLMGVSEKMVRNHWHSACLKLDQMLGGELPPM